MANLYGISGELLAEASWLDAVSSGATRLVAGTFVSIALFSIVFRNRLPRRIGGALFGFGVTVAAGAVAMQAGHSVADPILRMSLFAAAMTILWTCVGMVARRASTPGLNESRVIADSGTLEAILAWAMICGAGAAAGLLAQLMGLTWPRVITPNVMFEPISWLGLVAMGGLFAAILIWRAGGRAPQQPAVLLALAAIAVWWTSLMLPSASAADEIPEPLRLPILPAWWTWTFQLHVGLALVLTCAAIVQERRYRGRRRRAWPDRLDDLLAPYSRWPAYIEIESLLAAAVLVLGVYQIVRAGGRGWAMPATSAAAAIAAGSACLFMTYRRWSANTAGLGMALVTLGVVMCACAISAPFHARGEYPTYADRMPVLFNVVLFALVVMIWLWNWLARVWDQQLLDGVPWTTTGRMIPYARRTSFYLAAIALLAAFQMTLWRERSMSTNEDNGPYRMIFGPLAILLFSWQCAAAARRRHSPAWATFSVAALVAAMTFVFLRLPASDMRGWLSQYGPVVLATLAVPILIVAETLPTSTWRSFSGPLWFVALLFMPLKVLVDLLPGAVLPEQWVRAAALAILAILYFIAAGREHRRAFFVLGAVLLLASGSEVYRMV